jgi:hypothetical protein
MNIISDHFAIDTLASSTVFSTQHVYTVSIQSRAFTTFLRPVLFLLLGHHLGLLPYHRRPYHLPP